MTRKFTKRMLATGGFHAPEGIVNVTDLRRKSWEDKAKRISEMGYKIPVHFDHQDTKECLPQEPGEHEEKRRMGAAQTVGSLVEFRAHDDYAEVVIETDDPKAIHAIETNKVFVSPVLFDSWQSGTGAVIDDIIGAFDLVDLPVDYSQGPFKPVLMSTLGENDADRMGMSVIRMATKSGKRSNFQFSKDDEKNDEKNEKESEASDGKDEKKSDEKSDKTADKKDAEPEGSSGKDADDKKVASEKKDEPGSDKPVADQSVAPGVSEPPKVESDPTAQPSAAALPTESEKPVDAPPIPEVAVDEINDLGAGEIEGLSDEVEFVDPAAATKDPKWIAGEIKKNLLAIGIVAPEGVDIVSDPLGFGLQLSIALKQKHMDSGGAAGSYEYPASADFGLDQMGQAQQNGVAPGGASGAPMSPEGGPQNGAAALGEVAGEVPGNTDTSVAIDGSQDPGASKMLKKKKYDEKDLTEPAPSYLSMGTTGQINGQVQGAVNPLVERIEKLAKADIRNGLDNLLRTGRCTPAEHAEKVAELGATRMSVDPANGTCGSIKVQDFIAHRKPIPTGTCWPTKRRMSTVDGGLVDAGKDGYYETSIPDGVLDGVSCDPERAKEVVDEMERRHPGRFKKKS